MKKYVYAFALVFFVACSKDRLLTIAPTIAGCTDLEAANYSPEATEDDGGCLFVGCTDSIAINFSPAATIDDGSCLYDGLIGCGDSSAINYDSAAVGCGSPSKWRQY